jgi:hypothetical protein
LTTVEAELSALVFAAVPVVSWFRVGNVQLVSVPELGVPKAGVTRAGDVALTKTPVPVPVYSAEVE